MGRDAFPGSPSATVTVTVRMAQMKRTAPGSAINQVGHPVLCALCQGHLQVHEEWPEYVINGDILTSPGLVCMPSSVGTLIP